MVGGGGHGEECVQSTTVELLLLLRLSALSWVRGAAATSTSRSRTIGVLTLGAEGQVT
jgi:hypothetical protein